VDVCIGCIFIVLLVDVCCEGAVGSCGCYGEKGNGEGK